MLIRDIQAETTTGRASCEPRAGARGPFRRILVPVDGSAQAEQPLALALRIARACEGDLHLMWARPDSHRGTMPEGGRSTRMSHLEALTEEVSDRLGAPVCRAVRGGRPADAILEQVREADIELIVMASRGHAGLWRLGIGGTTDAVLRSAQVPVLVIRAPDEEEPDLDRAVEIEEIVVALDGSDAAEAALTPAIELSRLMHAGLTLLRVAETPSLPLPSHLFTSSERTREHLATATRDAHIYLDRVAARLRAGGLAVNTAVRDASSAASGILRFAREVDADVIAIGTQGTGNSPRLMRGRTAATLLHDAALPLLVMNTAAGAS